MRVPDIILGCVCFLCYKDEHSMHFAGTAFFLGDDQTKPGSIIGYTVTAWHVIQNISERSHDNKVYLKLNTVDGETEYLDTELNQWLRHPSDTSVDVAVLGWLPDAGKYEFSPYDVRLLLTPEIAIQENIGIGDDVFLAGLFRQDANKRNTPILRQGSIARMPYEPVPSLFGSIEAFLIEVRSLGGLSGSPVFVLLSSNRRTRQGFQFQPIAYLIGLVHGHYEGKIALQDELEQDQQKQREINAGIAIVVTANKILETLEHPELVKLRSE